MNYSRIHICKLHNSAYDLCSKVWETAGLLVNIKKEHWYWAIPECNSSPEGTMLLKAAFKQSWVLLQDEMEWLWHPKELCWIATFPIKWNDQKRQHWSRSPNSNRGGECLTLTLQTKVSGCCSPHNRIRDIRKVCRVLLSYPNYFRDLI